MNPIRPWQNLKQQFAATPLLAILGACALLIASLGLALYNDSLRKDENIRRVDVQAQILASSVAASLAFEDVAATQEYLNALKSNPEVNAAGVYDLKGHLVEGFTRSAALPTSNVPPGAHMLGRYLVFAAAVAQDNIQLGSVYLRVTIEPLQQRLIRYLGIGAVVIMAALFVAALGASHASIGEAHRKLQQEIKDREKAEEALRQAQKMEAMGQLTGGIAHDFNNLLMVASSGLELMDRTDDPKRREQLQQGLRQVIDRGARLTQQLLAFARRAPLKPQVVDLGACLRGIRDLLDRSLREDIVVDLRLATDLWPVEVDTSQFEVSVLNIALNARDAMPDGGTIVICTENMPADASRTHDMVRVMINDSGVGVPKEVLSRVFEPFFTTKEVGRGTGLGLSQVYGFVRASGGDVVIDSELHKGTSVQLWLPRSHHSLSAPTLPLEAIVVAATMLRLKVLLVEDDHAVAKLVAEMLDEMNYEVTRVVNAAAALEALRQDTFALVLSDMVMPGAMNGLDLAHAIEVEWPGLPIVLTTGYSAAAASATAKGMRLLLKPYRLETLRAELQAALAEARIAKEAIATRASDRELQ